MIGSNVRSTAEVPFAKRSGKALSGSFLLFALAVSGAMGLTSGRSVWAQGLAAHAPEYRLHNNDVLEVKFRYTPEFDQAVTVRPDGRVSLEVTGPFLAENLTVEEFRAEVLRLAAKRLVEPEVSVALKEFQKPFVLVEGEVNTPGRVELRSPISALDAIALAGGFKPTSSKSHVLLLRQDTSSPAHTRVLDLKALIEKRTLEEGTQLRPGDVIYVTQNTLSKVERLLHMGQFGAIYSPYR